MINLVVRSIVVSQQLDFDRRRVVSIKNRIIDTNQDEKQELDSAVQNCCIGCKEKREGNQNNFKKL